MRKKNILPVATLCIGCIGIGVSIGIMVSKKVLGGRC